MKTVALAATLSLALSAAAIAQTTAPAPSPTPPAANVPSATSPATTGSTSRAAINAAPLENGANSFTEEQAHQRLRDAGISDITGLAKDDAGVWRGRGSWQGKAVAVGLDFRGNISAQ